LPVVREPRQPRDRDIPRRFASRLARQCRARRLRARARGAVRASLRVLRRARARRARASRDADRGGDAARRGSLAVAESPRPRVNGRRALKTALRIALAFIIAILAPAGCAQADFKVTLLGTASPTPRPDRFGPSTLVEAGDQKLLFDAGRGVPIRLR